MMTIYLNEKRLMLNESCNLQTFLHQQGYAEAGYAVAVNRHFIPRAQYATTYLKEQDAIELVMPMQGG